jgi:diguanylate cyclase (GGDEF)-like protein/PAS domain S-box-containing protein
MNRQAAIARSSPRSIAPLACEPVGAPPATAAAPSRAACTGHFVQFYEQDDFLVAAIADWFAAGIEQGEACIVVATGEHRAALAGLLFERGLDVAALRDSRQLVEVDAHEALARFTIDEHPDEALFRQLFGGVIGAAAARFPKVRAFGEMVALLAHQGLIIEADRLEGFWNRLAEQHQFALFCAYPIGLFGGETNGRYFHDICNRHQNVIPAESYLTAADEAQRYRVVSELQQKALALTEESARRRQEQQRVRQRDERRRLLEDLSKDAICVARDARILAVNGRFLEMFGATHEWQVVGRDVMDFVHPDFHVVVRERMRALRSGHGDLPAIEQRMLGVDGQVIEASVTAASFDEDGETSIHVVLHDIGERRAALAREQQLAEVDGITGLPNRTRFKCLLAAALDAARATGQEVALLHVDLDRFKLVNDTLGDDAGDEVLRQAAARMTRTLREGAMLARVSSDEFTLLATGEDGVREGRKLAASLIAAFHEPFDVAGRPVFSTPSIGVAVFPHDGGEPTELLRAADLALHRSKQGGGNSLGFYTPSMAVESRKRLDLENRLHRALEQDEFRLCYQPIYDIDSGRIVGVEALLRWLPTDGPALPPSEFIPVAEETGLIQPIGDWVLRTACAQVREWQQSNPALADLRLSVNVSPRQLRDLDPRGSVQRFLDESGLAASQLTLELTESTFLKDFDLANRNLRQLRTMGVRLSIDDFGTGYSCLSYLRRLPIDELKIDRSFVHGLERKRGDVALVTAILAMAEALGLAVVAEGVQNFEQLEMLRQRGCKSVQGYGLGRPMMADEAFTFLAARLTAPAQAFTPEAFLPA